MRIFFFLEKIFLLKTHLYIEIKNNWSEMVGGFASSTNRLEFEP